MNDSDQEERLKRIEQKLDQLGGRTGAMRYGYGYEYKSKTIVFGLPLVHVATGIDLATGRKRIARGIIAIGDIAVGFLAIGGLSLGGICIGGLSLGLFSLAGFSIGLILAFGGFSVGYIALGGMAIGYYAIGGMAIGAHALGGNAQDPVFLETIRKYLGPNWPRKM